MACTNGSRKRASSPDFTIISAGEVSCAIYGESSLFCAYARGGLGAILPNAFIDVNAFCSSPPPVVDDIQITDLLNPISFIAKAIDVAKASKWGGLCECIPPPPNPPPFQGGQCCNFYYDVYGFVFFPGYPPSNTEQKIGQALLGKVVGVVRIEPSGAPNQTQFNLRMQRCDGSIYDTNLLSIGDPTNAGARISRVVSLSGADNCGDPPTTQPPTPEPDPLPPPPKLPPNAPPPPPPPHCKGCPPAPAGEKGETGATGATGAKGDKGDKGDTGSTGSKGDTGSAGVKGDKGDKGDAGVAGIAGVKGDRGETGTPGSAGVDGIPGRDGSPGSDGNVGATGERGERGDAGLSIKGDKGDKGDTGSSGRDAEVEFEPVTVTYSDCNAGGELIERSVSFQVIKGAEGSTKQLYTSLFSAVGSLEASVCKVTKSIDTLDLNVGIPLAGWERSTAVNTVLYFNDSRSTAKGIGRYICIPEPNNQKILEWAATDPEWLTGNWHYYTQYLTSKGAKISSFSVSFEKSVEQQTILKSFTNYQPTSIYFDSTPRMLHNKRELQLRLKRVTYFPGTIGQEGQQEGNVIFTNPLMR